jgi:hypothetical protein
MPNEQFTGSAKVELFTMLQPHERGTADLETTIDGLREAEALTLLHTVKSYADFVRDMEHRPDLVPTGEAGVYTAGVI